MQPGDGIQDDVNVMKLINLSQSNNFAESLYYMGCKTLRRKNKYCPMFCIVFVKMASELKRRICDKIEYGRNEICKCKKLSTKTDPRSSFLIHTKFLKKAILYWSTECKVTTSCCRQNQRTFKIYIDLNKNNSTYLYMLYCVSFVIKHRIRRL